MGYSVHGRVLPWAGLVPDSSSFVSSSNSLVWPWAFLTMDWAGHGLAWPCDGLAVDWPGYGWDELCSARHGLYCALDKLTISWPDHGLALSWSGLP